MCSSLFRETSERVGMDGEGNTRQSTWTQRKDVQCLRQNKLNECLKEVHLSTSMVFQVRYPLIFIYLKERFFFKKNSYITRRYHFLAYVQRTQQTS